MLSYWPHAGTICDVPLRTKSICATTMPCLDTWALFRGKCDAWTFWRSLVVHTNCQILLFVRCQFLGEIVHYWQSCLATVWVYQFWPYFQMLQTKPTRTFDNLGNNEAVLQWLHLREQHSNVHLFPLSVIMVYLLKLQVCGNHADLASCQPYSLRIIILHKE